MNEEISRILKLLEEGKIKADEAERLIRAISDVESRPHAWRVWSGPRFDPSREIHDVVRTIRRAVREAMRRQRRYAWWHYYEAHRWYEDARQERARTKSVHERVRYVLEEIAQLEIADRSPTARLRDDLMADEMAWDNLRSGLEEEFRLDIPTDDLKDLETVQAVEDYITSRLGPSTQPPKPETPPEAPAPVPPPVAARRRPRGAKAKPGEVME